MTGLAAGQRGDRAAAVPRPVAGIVSRPRLVERLRTGVERPLTLISGPAGSGKTQLVLSALRDGVSPGPVAWMSVDPGEHDAMRFWGTVAAALQTASAPDAYALALLGPAPRVRTGDFVGHLCDAVRELTVPTLLVIDDVHHLHSREALDGLASLLASRLPNLRVLMLTRRDPAVGLHRLRIAGALTEIRAGDLEFGPDEVAELVRRARITLSDESIERLRERTEGWAAGLRLAIVALADRDDPDAFVAQLSGSERTIADYLLSEVLSREPAHVRALLMRTSVLQRVNGPLANRLTGRRDGWRILRGLEDANVLVQAVDGRRAWFRYHPLLAGFLRDQLESDPEENVEQLHRAAARWFAGHGYPVDAIRHAEAARDWPQAVDLLMEHVFTLLLDGEAATFHALVDALPRPVDDDAEVAAVLAVDRLHAGLVDDAGALLALAERHAGSVPAPRRRRFDAVAAVSELYLARSRGDFEGALDRALPMLAPPGGETLADVVSSADLRALALMNVGFVELWARRLDDAEEHLTSGLALARRIDRPYLALCCLGPLAEVAQMKAAPERAREHATEAIAIAKTLGCEDGPVAAVAYSALGSVLTGEGRLDDAAACLEHAGRAFEGMHDVEAGVVLDFRLGLVRYAQRRYADAFECLREAEREYERISGSHYLGGFIEALRLRAAMRLGDRSGARDALERLDAATRGLAEWRTLASELHLLDGDAQAVVDELAPLLAGSVALLHPLQEPEALLLEAVARDRLGQREAAEGAIERALDIAERQGWFSITLRAPMALPLLRRHPRDRTRHGAFLAEVLDRLGEETEPPVGLPTDLSERERDVVRFLGTNLSAAEIASELLLSVHTVKTHMRRIYTKLDVHRRSDAVVRARELGLLAHRTNRAMHA